MCKGYWLTYLLLCLVAPLFSQQLHPVNTTGVTSQPAGIKPANDSEAENYAIEIQHLLEQVKFKEIDEIAVKERSVKSRFTGGGWKLRTLYDALSDVAIEDKASDVKWNARIHVLQQWIGKDPKSITPRVALAEVYINYAWQARGQDYTDKVTDDNFKLFGERIDLAKTTLDEGAALKEKCPQWYNSMQSVALGQTWSKAQAAKLFEEAIAFEPGYYYFYDQYTNYLLPKWNGEEGEAEQFADAITSRIGGKEGSIIYFKIAANIGCHCNNESVLQKMSWQKIQQGYGAVTELYGTSVLVLNQFAYMAIKMKDAEVAQKMFERIGDNWNKEIWRTSKYFDTCKNWAAYATKMLQEIKAAALIVDQNLQTQEGREYDSEISREFATRFSDPVQKCVQEAGKDLENSGLLVQIGSAGQVQTILSSHPTHISDCLYSKLREMTFSSPPKPAYWVKIDLQVHP